MLVTHFLVEFEWAEDGAALHDGVGHGRASVAGDLLVGFLSTVQVQATVSKLGATVTVGLNTS